MWKVLSDRERHLIINLTDVVNLTKENEMMKGVLLFSNLKGK